jgi:hypothetical protein
MKLNELVLSEQELIAEGILDTLKNSVTRVKNYAANISAAAAAHKELKSLDGKKTWSTANLKQEAIRIRNELAAAYSAFTAKTKAVFDTAIAKMGAASLKGTYTSRNYYRDFLAYSMMKPVVDLSMSDVGKAVTDKLIDQLTGFVITAVTGVPSLADLKDVADVVASMTKASGTLASKINSLKPAQVAEALFKS